MSAKTINDLDDASLQYLLSLLPLKTLKRCRGVSKRFKVQCALHIRALEIPRDEAMQIVKCGPMYEKFPAVKELKVSGNHLDHFLESFARWKLEKLTIRGYEPLPISAARALASPGGPWANLLVLHLDYLDLAPEHLTALAAATWSSLEELAFLGRQQLLTDQGKALAKLLSRCSALKKLKLSRLDDIELVKSSFGAASLNEIMKVEMPLLEEFEARVHFLNGSPMQVFVNKSSSWPSLKVLKLACIKHTNAEFRTLTQANFPLLENFTFTGNFEGVVMDVESMLALRSAIKTRWGAMKRVNVFPVDSAAEVAFLEGNVPMLEELSFGANYLLTETLKALATALEMDA